jgi:type I restriction enzyme, S subunit
VDEIHGTIARPERRSYREVARGFTYFREEDVLFAKITPCMENGKAAIARGLLNGIGFGSTEFHVLRPKSAVMPQWIFAFVRQQSFRTEAEANFTGTAGQQRVPMDFLQRVLILVPPLSEQERIVRILDEAEELRRLRERADRRTADLIPAIFHERFGDPETNPMKWPVHSLGELMADGPQNGLYKHSSAYGDGTPILRIDSFYDGRVTDFSRLRRLRLTDDEVARYKLHEGDIVINRVNSPEFLGKSALIPALPEAIVFESNMMRFSLSPKRIDSGYLIHYLQTPTVKRHILSRAKHSINQSSINQEDVKSLSVPLPPPPLQREFATWVVEVRALETKQAENRRRLEDLFASLLHRAFRGEL